MGILGRSQPPVPGQPPLEGVWHWAKGEWIKPVQSCPACKSSSRYLQRIQTANGWLTKYICTKCDFLVPESVVMA